MAKIFITGDIHGDIDIRKLTICEFPEGRELTKDDYVIICGDFGLVWHSETNESFWLKWLSEQPWTTLFVDGNHEDFDLLKTYPIEEWHGGKVHKITESIYHLMRGEVFELNGLTFFSFGGAFSHDREYREEGVSWWQDELPTHDEVNHALDNLEKYNCSVDVILTHDAPKDIQDVLGMNHVDMTPYDCQYENICSFLQHIKNTVQYKAWFMGHYHMDRDYHKHHLLYYDIVELTPWLLNRD